MGNFAAVSIIIAMAITPECLKALIQLVTLTLATIIQHRKQRPQRLRQLQRHHSPRQYQTPSIVTQNLHHHGDNNDTLLHLSVQ